jgi:hypothetical protein
MSDPHVLPPELAKAAANLETRFQLLDVPTRKVPLVEWNVLDARVRVMIPAWLPALLSQFSLVGGVIEYRDPRGLYGGGFAFWTPDIYAERFASGDDLLEECVLAQGYVPLSDEEHGNLWVTEKGAGPDSPIYVWDLSAQDNTFACRSITRMLTVMAVSEQSCSRPLMWARE